jgi:stage II sporulation protein D
VLFRSHPCAGGRGRSAEAGTATRVPAACCCLTMRAFTIAFALLLLVPATAGADLVVDGRGWGHGVGLSQYGAYGFALREGRDHRSILAHYYTGSGYDRAPATRMRVRLKRGRSPKVGGATRARAANRRSLRLRSDRSYRFRAYGSNRLRVIDARTGRTRARLLAPVTVTGGSSTVLYGRAENGLGNGAYRGRMVLSRSGRSVLAVNHVSLEHYLYGVVPAEMPASWPVEALRAQAVVARSYALTSRRPGEPYDVFADVRSQVYRGVLGEVDSTTAAVRATRANVVTVGGEVAQTFFFSTSGGRTAGNEEVWGGSPLSYLRSVEDPHDDLSPVHTWRARFSRREAERMLGSVLDGDLEGLRVASRTPSGRAATVVVRGTRGDRTVSAATVRTLLGLRSTWITRVSGP